MFQREFALLESDAQRAALARGSGGRRRRTGALLSLEPIPGKNWKPDELEALRARAVEAIEDYLDTSRIELDDPDSIKSFNGRLSGRRGTGEASLGIQSNTPSLRVFDMSANVRSVNGFLKSLGFVGGIVPTPTPTPTPQRRPIS